MQKNQSTDMKPIQNSSDKNKKKELPKQTSKNADNKNIPKTERKNRKLEEKILSQLKY